MGTGTAEGREADTCIWGELVAAATWAALTETTAGGGAVMCIWTGVGVKPGEVFESMCLDLGLRCELSRDR